MLRGLRVIFRIRIRHRFVQRGEMFVRNVSRRFAQRKRVLLQIPRERLKIFEQRRGFGFGEVKLGRICHFRHGHFSR